MNVENHFVIRQLILLETTIAERRCKHSATSCMRYRHDCVVAMPNGTDAQLHPPKGFIGVQPCLHRSASESPCNVFAPLSAQFSKNIVEGGAVLDWTGISVGFQ